MRRKQLIVLLCILGGFLFCKDKEKIKRNAQAICSSCHLFPEPAIHAQKDWPVILFRMGLFLGIEDYSLVESKKKRRYKKLYTYLQSIGKVSQKKILTKQQFSDIVDYYTDNSPDALPLPAKNDFHFNDFKFEAQSFMKEIEPSAWVVPVKIMKDNTVYAGDILHAKLYHFSNTGKLLKKIQLPSPAIKIVEHGNKIYLGLIGHLRPSDKKAGQVIQLDSKYRIKPLIKQLFRLADFTVTTSLSKKTKILTSGFGNNLGRTSIFTKYKNTFTETILGDRAGGIKSEVIDLNHDGKADILWLISQGDERLILYLNKGHDQFEEKVLIQKHPAFGFVRFYLADFNNDRQIDILTINGDNGDIPGKPLRNYHGVRIFYNQGNLHFEEKFFYPMHGVVEATIADFDNDNDKDIAVVANYPDIKNPENFVILENYEHSFRPHHIRVTTRMELGSIDAKDIDGDGDVDILIGGRNTGKFANSLNDAPNHLLLKNTRK